MNLVQSCNIISCKIKVFISGMTVKCVTATEVLNERILYIAWVGFSRRRHPMMHQ
jgi:hypothetical protein